MRILRIHWLVGPGLIFGAVLAAVGCYHAPLAPDPGPAPLRMPPPEGKGDACDKCYEDSLTGGQVFTMYCSYCHNAPTLAERPFSNYKNVAAHMRVRANLTGKEYDKLVEFLQRWHDVPGPERHEPPSPKRMIPSQPIAELRGKEPPTAPDLPAGPRPATNDAMTPGQPDPGSSPREGR
ncbi:MAG TPA: hypothetical protein VH120_15255 [Gemmataceae bacterium]|nr:hypothetical protein [Gemmataceae bacterium]